MRSRTASRSQRCATIGEIVDSLVMRPPVRRGRSTRSAACQRLRAQFMRRTQHLGNHAAAGCREMPQIAPPIAVGRLLSDPASGAQPLDRRAHLCWRIRQPRGERRLIEAAARPRRAGTTAPGTPARSAANRSHHCPSARRSAAAIGRRREHAPANVAGRLSDSRIWCCQR